MCERCKEEEGIRCESERGEYMPCLYFVDLFKILTLNRDQNQFILLRTKTTATGSVNSLSSENWFLVAGGK